MKVTPIKTHKITPEDDLFAVLDKYINSLPEKSVIAVASKIVAITEGRVVKADGVDKNELVREEADLYLPWQDNPYGFHITIKNGIMLASGGIDESNGNGYFVLWPQDPQESANRIRWHLKRRCHLNNLGVIITDSRTSPLRWGVTGVGIAHSGFQALYSYVDKPDVFGRKMRVEKLNLPDCLASATVVVTGEGDEQTPIAVIEDIPRVTFQDRNPTDEELATLRISIDEDIYAPLLKSVKWEKGSK